MFKDLLVFCYYLWFLRNSITVLVKIFIACAILYTIFDMQNLEKFILRKENFQKEVDFKYWSKKKDLYN